MQKNDQDTINFLERLRQIEKNDKIGETVRHKRIIPRRFTYSIRKKLDQEENQDYLPDISVDNTQEIMPKNMDELEERNDDEQGDLDITFILELAGLLAAGVIFVKIIYPMISKLPVITPEKPVQAAQNVTSGNYALQSPPSPYLR